MKKKANSIVALFAACVVTFFAAFAVASLSGPVYRDNSTGLASPSLNYVTTASFATYLNGVFSYYPTATKTQTTTTTNTITVTYTSTSSATYALLNLVTSSTSTALNVNAGAVRFSGAQISNVAFTNGPYFVSDTDYEIYVGSSSNMRSIVLPSSPTEGRVLIIKDLANSAGVYNKIVVGRNGKKINNVASDYFMPPNSVYGTSIKILYNSTTSNWEIFGAVLVNL